MVEEWKVGSKVGIDNRNCFYCTPYSVGSFEFFARQTEQHSTVLSFSPHSR